MQRLLLIALAVVVLTAGYFFLKPLQSIDPDTAPAQPTAETQQQAREHINRLTQGTEQPIAIGQADNFVTADQLLDLPATKVQGTAAIASEESSDDTASGATFAVSSHMNVITSGQHQGNTISGSDLPLSLSGKIKLQELLDNPDQSGQHVYFIHAVNEGDDKGLWGIIQHGLMRTFTAGLTLPGLDKTVQVDIPEEADEKLADKRSSFLGQILKNKVDQTYIYNYEKGILGENPDLIKPGQQLIIVTFTEQELIGIYHHFVTL